MFSPLVPARLAFTAEGTPYSAAFDDIYHSSAGGAAQARHVFLNGNELPERWQRRQRFTILETGFGFGLNFLATWAAWREDPERPARLHFVSIEKHPFRREDLAQLHAHHPQFSALAAGLHAAWPMLVPGMHRMEFESGRVVLTLFLGDIAKALPQLRLAADAFFLDGFAPAKNPDMWSLRVIKAIGRLATANATLATYSAAVAVRDALGAAGFRVEKRPGFASKRDMLCARFALPRQTSPAVLRSAIVIGAGLAGSAVCERLSARGWEVALIERHALPAQEASGNHAGAFHPLVTRDDSFMARLSRASFLYALAHWQTLENLSWARCGVLQMARDAEEEAAQRAALETLGFPLDYVHHLSRAQAVQATATAVATDGLWFPQGGWIQPASLTRALLAKARVSKHFGVEVARLERGPAAWVASDAEGAPIATAPIVVLANAREAVRLAPLAHIALRSVRGQVSHLPAQHFPAIRAVLLRGGMALPPVDGIAVTGSSYDIGNEDPEPCIDSHRGNLERLARILPYIQNRYDATRLAGRVAFRAVARDRLPLVGPLVEQEGLFGAFAYASRGIIWCSLMAELLASQLEHEPWPIERQLANAVAPARFSPRK